MTKTFDDQYYAKVESMDENIGVLYGYTPIDVPLRIDARDSVF